MIAQGRRDPAGALKARRLHHPAPMTTRMLVTCPESAHLEEIEYEDDPLGLLIIACSRHEPLACPRTCASRLDRRDKGRTDPEIICASRDNTALVMIRRKKHP